MITTIAGELLPGSPFQRSPWIWGVGINVIRSRTDDTVIALTEERPQVEIDEIPENQYRPPP